MSLAAPTSLVPSTPGVVVPAGGPPPLPSLPPLNNKGAFLIGTYLSLILYGIFIHQVYMYFRIYRKDKVLVKVMVHAMIMIETIHTAACMHICYHYLVSNYFNPLSLLHCTRTLDMIPILTGLLILVSQSFFSWRVYTLRPKSSPLVAVAVILSIVSFGFMTAATVEATHVASFQRYESHTWLTSVALSAAVVSDAITVSVLTAVLTKRRTGIKQTDQILQRLILYAVNTGLLTGIFNILALVFALVWRDNYIYIGVAIAGGKVYSNSLLAVLNTRQSLAARGIERGENGTERGLSLPVNFSCVDPSAEPVVSPGMTGAKAPKALASALVRGQALTAKPDLWTAQHQMASSDTAIELELKAGTQTLEASGRV
ncbi:hypothetical protein C8Q77DRAFT_1128873 [Trametes polyzona]|nr:hypothetical protein C8Q77DRAFT_1128873 [Trametes polyzona]